MISTQFDLNPEDVLYPHINILLNFHFVLLFHLSHSRSGACCVVCIDKYICASGRFKVEAHDILERNVLISNECFCVEIMKIRDAISTISAP